MANQLTECQCLHCLEIYKKAKSKFFRTTKQVILLVRIISTCPGRFTAQKHIMRNYLQRMGDYDTKVTTTTGALGTQADIVIFSLVRNNPERNVGAAGTLQDLNVPIVCIDLMNL